IPPLTYIGFIVAVLLTGSVVTETVFSWPGVGLLAIDAVRYRDFPVVQTVVLLYAAKFVLINLVVDVAYVYVDPRIRYQR
ncbi:MAG: ABC transporter permease subunit, partial [Candidatus Limnocylindria bacterium]